MLFEYLVSLHGVGGRIIIFSLVFPERNFLVHVSRGTRSVSRQEELYIRAKGKWTHLCVGNIHTNLCSCLWYFE